jgi:hypothetical protein
LTYHDAAREGNASATVRVGHYVSVADAKQRDGDQPHRVEKICVVYIVEPAEKSFQNLPLFFNLPTQ